MYSTIGWHVFFVMYLAGKMENPRLFVRHTRMSAGSGHSVKVKPFGAASRALTFMPWLPASYTRGRRTRKPPEGALSKEAPSRKYKDRGTKKRVLSLTVFPHTDTRRKRYMQICPDVCPTEFFRFINVAPCPAFRCPRRYAHHADHSVNRILIERCLHGAQSFAAYRLLICRMLARYRRHTHQRHAGYNSTPCLIRIRHIPDARIMRTRFRTDACSFVRRYPAGPAYVSSIRRTYILTAGEGLCPFEPREDTKTKEGEGARAILQGAWWNFLRTFNARFLREDISENIAKS